MNAALPVKRERSRTFPAAHSAARVASLDGPDRDGLRDQLGPGLANPLGMSMWADLLPVLMMVVLLAAFAVEGERHERP